MLKTLCVWFVLERGRKLLNLQLTLILMWLTTTVAKTIGPVGTITIANKEIAPDGFKRPASLIDGAHPGPIITAQKGDRVKINVINELSDPNQMLGTTIHWHGMFQKGTNFMDGTAGVTQCPIAPNNSFQYDFQVSGAGTFWYHSHFGVQYCDGVRGAFIVYDPSDPLKSLYDVDDESTIITLSEWYHLLAVDVTAIELADSTLINGKGRYPSGDNTELAVVNVQQGQRYRLRLISISCDPNFTFSVDGHNLTVIEVEGIAVTPETVNSIRIYAGQRYSVVLDASQPIDNYWIRALPDSGHENLSSTFENGVNSAILRYGGAGKQEPTSMQQTQITPLIEANLHPSSAIEVPGEADPNGADETFNFTFGYDPDTSLFSVNNVVYNPPAVPVLLQILSGAKNAHDLLPKGSVYTVERNKTVQINLPSGLIGGPHPFHLHGHNFHVVRSADTGEYNFDNPVVRDTVNAGDTEGDYVAIRFRTDNPGPWIFHCHIDFHMKNGLAVVFAEAPDDIAAANPNPPEEWDQLCPIWDSEPNFVKHAGTSSPA
uniref:laccase n=1 Tax=Agaricus bisporus var. bisporus TaxID=192523 RepID=D2D2A3_AGABI|nr:putative laccase 4 precursor [Agaricus bisporus var. bisporus]